MEPRKEENKADPNSYNNFLFVLYIQTVSKQSYLTVLFNNIRRHKRMANRVREAQYRSKNI